MLFRYPQLGLLLCLLVSLSQGESVTAPPSSPRPQATSEHHNPGPTPKAPESRRPLETQNPHLKGTDITIFFPEKGDGENKRRPRTACQSTPVAKKELDSQQCKVAYFTAAHCVDDSDITAIDFAGIGEIPKKDLQIAIPSIYFTSGGPKSRSPVGGDSAVIVFNIDCEKVRGIVPVPLARVDKNGIPELNMNENVYLQKRRNSTAGNRGEGAQIAADFYDQDSQRFVFKVPSPQGYTIVGGDSGGPVFNQKGQLICPISGSSYEWQKQAKQLTRIPDGNINTLLDPFTVNCDKRAVARLRKTLEQFELL